MSLWVELDCGPCRLRPWRLSDRDALLRYANDRRIWRNLRDRFPHPYGPAEADAWLGYAASVPPPDGVWAIEVDGEAVGSLAIERGRDAERCRAEIGYWLGQPLWGRGIATAAVRAATDRALAEPGLWRVDAPVYAWNPASMRVLEKAGYEREAVLRSATIKDGSRVDLVIYARTREPDVADPAAE